MHRASDLPEVQEHIEQTLLKLLKTERGRFICSEVLSADPENMKFYLGFVSHENAEAAAKLCDAGTKDIGVLINSKPREFPRRYYIIFNAPDSVVDSYTHLNKTLLVYHEKVIPPTRLDRQLSHETPVNFFDQMTYAQLNNFPCEIKNYFFHPVVKDAFAALRAFAFEKEVLGTAPYEELTCLEKLDQVVTDLSEIGHAIAAKSQTNNFCKGSIKTIFDNYTVDSVQSELRASLAQTKNHALANPSLLVELETFCQQASLARVQGRDIYWSGGPRPRTGPR